MLSIIFKIPPKHAFQWWLSLITYFTAESCCALQSLPLGIRVLIELGGVIF